MSLNKIKITIFITTFFVHKTIFAQIENRGLKELEQSLRFNQQLERERLKDLQNKNLNFKKPEIKNIPQADQIPEIKIGKNKCINTKKIKVNGDNLSQNILKKLFSKYENKCLGTS